MTKDFDPFRNAVARLEDDLLGGAAARELREIMQSQALDPAALAASRELQRIIDLPAAREAQALAASFDLSAAQAAQALAHTADLDAIKTAQGLAGSFDSQAVQAARDFAIGFDSGAVREARALVRDTVLADIMAGRDMARELSALMGPFGDTLQHVKLAQAQVADSFKGIGLWKEQLTARPDWAVAAEAMEAHLQASFAAERLILPDMAAAREMARVIADLVEPSQRYFADMAAWQTSLAGRMAAVEAPWVQADEAAFGGVAFAELSRLSDTLFDAPYDARVCGYVIEEFGAPVETREGEPDAEREARYSEAGRNSALVAFERESYPHVIVAAGFQLYIPAAPPPTADEAGDPSAHFDPSHNAVMTHLEQHLRRFITAQLQALEGAAWLRRRVSQALRDRWTERRDAARVAGRPVYPLIEYADFMDLGDLIVQGDNWRDVFRAVFQTPDAVRVSLARLHPIRRDIAHSRPLGQTDVLFLVAETTRLLTAIGIPLRHN